MAYAVGEGEGGHNPAHLGVVEVEIIADERHEGLEEGSGEVMAEVCQDKKGQQTGDRGKRSLFLDGRLPF